jgi:hypothetical protein
VQPDAVMSRGKQQAQQLIDDVGDVLSGRTRVPAEGAPVRGVIASVCAWVGVSSPLCDWRPVDSAYRAL